MERPPLIGKHMTFGEKSLSAIFVALAIATAYIASKAYTPAFAFHAALFSLGSIGAVVAIVLRYRARGPQLPPRIIDGRPNYNYGPIKFAVDRVAVLGRRRLLVGLYIALWSSLSRFSISICPGSISGVCGRCTPRR